MPFHLRVFARRVVACSTVFLRLSFSGPLCYARVLSDRQRHVNGLGRDNDQRRTMGECVVLITVIITPLVRPLVRLCVVRLLRVILIGPLTYRVHLRLRFQFLVLLTWRVRFLNERAVKGTLCRVRN